MQHLQHTSVMPSIVYEKEREEHCRSQVVRAIEWRVKGSYGFLPVSKLFTHTNARGPGRHVPRLLFPPGEQLYLP